MAVFRCKMCGAQLDVKPGQLVCECGYCGSTQTIPNGDDEQKIALYNRANNLRFRSDFDKAIVAYQSIVAKYPKESEAHWGLCLSKYGIEYVDDPKSGEKIPTCHRTLYESILEDSDYLDALENADVIAKDIYMAEAKEIDRIQKRIIRISQKEDPYDIFICYKESDDAGGRTIDSVLAQDIYDKLVDKGYKVFFARITLENKLGQEYEPIIFAALRSAKVMLVVGTKEEHFNAVWVKNEWSRFLSFMANDKNKYLIPCYKDVDPYDMPEEFTPLQSQDLGKIGYLQDLARGIDKIFGRDEKKATKVVASAAVGSFSGYYSRIEQAIKNGQFEKADWLIESVLAGDENDARAYYYKIFVEAQNSDLDFLGKDSKDPFDYRNFSVAYRNANPEFKVELDEIIARAKKNQLEHDYDLANSYEEDCDYDKAIDIFKSLGDYKDSKQRIKDCEKEKEEYEAANERARQITEINGYINGLNKKKVENSEQIKKSRASIASFTSKQNRKKNFSRIASVFGFLCLGSAVLNIIIFLIVGLVSYFNSGYEIMETNYLGFFIALLIMYAIQIAFCGLFILFIHKTINPTFIFVINIILTSVAYIVCIVFASLFSGYSFAWGIGIGPLYLEWFVLGFSIPYSIFCRKSNETIITSSYSADIQGARDKISELEEKNRQIDSQIAEYKNQISMINGEELLDDVPASVPKTDTSQSIRPSSYTNRNTGPSVGNRVLGMLNGIFGAVACGCGFLADIVAASTGSSSSASSLRGFSFFLIFLHIAFFIVFLVFSRKRPNPIIGFIFSVVHTVLIIVFLANTASLYVSYEYTYTSIIIMFAVFAMIMFIASTIVGLIRMIKYRNDN